MLFLETHHSILPFRKDLFQPFLNVPLPEVLLLIVTLDGAVKSCCAYRLNERAQFSSSETKNFS